MIPRYFAVAVILMLNTIPTIGQEINNTSSYRNINADGYVRIYGDNDYFANTDQQYTEGVNFEINMSWVRDFPLSKLLVHPRFGYIRYGIGVEQAGYTPKNLQNEVVMNNDRPFAATLFLITFQVATDTVRKHRFATTLSTGVIGPSALGDKIQDAVHVFLNDVVPPGWKYQVQNDVILNYEIDYQKQLLAVPHILSFDVEGMARGGALSDKQGAGIDLMLGYFESPFSASTKSGFQFYIYDNPEVDVVEYDATLQGGVFDNSSTYTIPAANISRYTFMNRLGMVMVYKGIRLEYNECYLTKQFSTGPDHLWGGVELAIAVRNKKK